MSTTPPAARRLPHGFLLGAATAAYQVEGATGEDGRGRWLTRHVLQPVHPDVGPTGENVEEVGGGDVVDVEDALGVDGHGGLPFG